MRNIHTTGVVVVPSSVPIAVFCKFGRFNLCAHMGRDLWEGGWRRRTPSASTRFGEINPKTGTTAAVALEI